MRRRSLVALAVVAAASACGPEENDGAITPTSKVLEWTASVGDVQPAVGGGTLVNVALRAKVEPGWKVYSLTQKGGGPVAMRVALDSLSPYERAGEITASQAERAKDPNFGIETETYAGSPAFVVPVLVRSLSDPGKPIELRVRSQACSDKLCLPARTTTVSVPAPTEVM